jgi:hypothetical protein
MFIARQSFGTAICCGAPPDTSALGKSDRGWQRRQRGNREPMEPCSSRRFIWSDAVRHLVARRNGSPNGERKRMVGGISDEVRAIGGNRAAGAVRGMATVSRGGLPTDWVRMERKTGLNTRDC